MAIIQRSFMRKILPAIRNRRLVSTSNKKCDTAVVAEVTNRPPKEKNWVSYGFSFKSKEEDRFALHTTMFAGISICLVVGTFYFAYLPDYQLKDWSSREAFLELKRREENGLPLVDPNFIDPAKIVLPTDEELGDMDIVI